MSGWFRAGAGRVLVALITLTGCTSFPTIEANECGNGVLEPEAGEACDSFVDPVNRGAVCRPPGVASACQFDCSQGADGTGPRCPEGFGCTADGICRKPSGGYEAALQLSADVSSWLGAADFDGDGRQELISTEEVDQLQRGRFRLHYFDRTAQLTDTRTFPRVTTRPQARDLNGDGASDLAFTNNRVGVVPGRADKQWIPEAFSSYVVPSSGLRVLSARADLVGGAAPLVALTSIDGQRGVYVPSVADDGKLSKRAALAHPLTRLAGAVAANLNSSPDSPCAEVVLAFAGDTSFEVLDMCRLGTEGEADVVWRERPREQLLTLPAGAQIDAGPLIVDRDGDGNLDVVIGAGGKAYIAYGTGAGLASGVSRLALPVSGQAAPAEIPMPLAAGDLSGDGVADFVFPTGVVTSRRSLADGSIGYSISFENTGQPWTMAAVADLNGNQLPDVIAATEGIAGLSFLNGTGGPYQVPARLTSRGSIRFLTFGDFDGDLITDVAFIENLALSSSSDSLSVAFGVRDGTPAAPIHVAELSGVSQLGAYANAGLDSLFTASSVSRAAQATSTLTLFETGTDRLPLAPYELVTFSVDGNLQDSMADALVLGAFSERGSNDALVLGLDHTSTWSFWLVPKLARGNDPPRLLSGALPNGVLPSTPVDQGARLSVAGTAVDLDGDGLDEAAWLMPQGDDACALLIYGIDAARDQLVLKQQLGFDEPCASPELVASDLHEAGSTHLLALMGNADRAPRQLEILWNDGNGSFSFDARSVVRAPKGQDIRAFSVFPRQPRIALVTPSAGYVLDTSHDAQRFDVRQKLSVELDDARGIVVMDPNDDDVPDIVVADTQGLWLLPAELK